MRKRLTYANVISTFCLFLVLGGSAYAAVTITGKDVVDETLTSADVKDHSLLAADFKDGELPDVPPPPPAREPAGTLILPGVPGDGPDGAITVRSMAWSNTFEDGALGGGGGGKTTFGDVVITKAPDSSSPLLFHRTATGLHIPQATIRLAKPGAASPYATYTFKDVVVKSFATSGKGDERQDEVALGFSSVVTGSPAFEFDPAAELPAVTESRIGRMTVDGIPGSIDLTLNSWVAVNAGGQPAPQIGPFTVSKAVDADSAALLQRFEAGMHTKKITVELLQPGSDDVYSTYVLTDVVLTRFDVAGDGRPLERLALDAARIESIVPLPGGGEVRSCFDRKLNTTC